MPPVLIDGVAVATRIRAQIKADVDILKSQNKRPPCLAVILVGDDPASQIYVANKEKACVDAGILGRSVRLPIDTTQEVLLDVINDFNNDPSVDGILLQLPIPKHLNRDEAVAAIAAKKDVDGLTPENQGHLIWKHDCLVACTPLGIMELMREYKVNIAGKVAVVMGRSILVGGPTATLLSNAGATVISVHSGTVDPKQWTKLADIVVVATGVHHILRADWVKPGAVVIDVGIHRRDGKLSGDVCFDEVAPLASMITPVPKGVGPMTIAMLLSNCLKAYRKSII